MFFHLSREQGGAFSMRMEHGCQDLLSWDLASGERIQLLGDPVPRDPTALPQSLISAQGRIDLEKLYDLVPGHYYWFHWRGDSLECGSSFCGILPVYHSTVDGRLDISSSSGHIARTRRLTADDEGHRLERDLFNYPLFGRTPWKGIRLLPTHTRLVVRGMSATVEKGFAVEAHFGDGQRSSTADMQELISTFDTECSLLLPESGFALSFTGGFDGRTLLGAALKLGRSGFRTYGFGKPGESDIALPEKQARELGVPYTAIQLDERYVTEHALRSAIAFMELSDFNGNLGRPHYHYAAERLSGECTHLVTGNFGSELFRSMHAPGAMMTPHLMSIFTGGQEWRKPALELGGHQVGNELLAHVDAYLATAAGLTSAQRFYRFVFEELFRKYFGPEITVQSHFLRNRTPFLSLRFLKALHRTTWAGVHARLFESDKLRRMKGQVFYAAYLKHAHPRLYRMRTNKGYAPPDVLERWRWPLLLTSFMRRRLAGPERVDSNSIEAFFKQHQQALLDRYGLPVEAGEDLQRLSNRVAWVAADQWGG